MFPGSFPEESEVETKITPIREIYLISSDIEATRAELVDRGVDVSEPFHFGPEGQTPGLDPGMESHGEGESGRFRGVCTLQLI